MHKSESAQSEHLVFSTYKLKDKNKYITTYFSKKNSLLFYNFQLFQFKWESSSLFSSIKHISLTYIQCTVMNSLLNILYVQPNYSAHWTDSLSESYTSIHSSILIETTPLNTVSVHLFFSLPLPLIFSNIQLLQPYHLKLLSTWLFWQFHQSSSQFILYLQYILNFLYCSKYLPIWTIENKSFKSADIKIIQ